MASRALILVDLQNEFLAQGGNFSIDAGSRMSLVWTLNILVPAFRSAGGQLGSDYAVARSGTLAATTKMEAPMLIGFGGRNTPRQESMLPKGLFGAQLAPTISKLFRKEDLLS
jgi:nicotinamidase-related amidase